MKKRKKIKDKVSKEDQSDIQRFFKEDKSRNLLSGSDLLEEWIRYLKRTGKPLLPE